MKIAIHDGSLVAVAPVMNDVAPGVLSGREIERARSFASSCRRSEFLTARWLTRRVLAEVLAVDPRSLPALLGPLPLVVDDHYVCLSHSNGMVAVAVRPGGRVAVDIESEGVHMPRLAHRFAGAAPEASTREATQVWARWEACRKLEELAGRVTSWHLTGAQRSHALAVAMS